MESIYTLCPEKRDQNVFFVISRTIIRRWWRNLVHCFLNTFAEKWCKRFPPHLNNVSTLPCETWNDHCTCATIELPLNLSHLSCGLQIRQIWNQLITACRKYCNRRCIKKLWHWCGAISDANDTWLLQWWLDPAWPTPFFWVAVSVHPV